MAENTVCPHDLSPVAADLAALIRRDGPLTVAAFMEKAASVYYARQSVFGRDGDFTTAPEISQLFGEMIAVWLMDMWMRNGRPDYVQLIELGPGRGTLSADIMRTLKAWPDLRNAITLHLVETSPRLREMQATALARHTPAFYDRLDDVPQGFSFIIANEFLDALPIHQFEKCQGVWKERAVDCSGTPPVFHFTQTEADPALIQAMPPEFAQAPHGAIFEISPASLTVIEQICQRINRTGGAALVIDYGHDQPGLGDTLQALEKHGFADPLGNPGGRDITAHVDFATCRMAAESIATVHGPVTQGAFLQRLGIVERASALIDEADDADKRDVQSGLLRLTSPGQMGRLFKVMALTPKESTIIPAGFADDTGGEEHDHNG